MKCFFMYSEYQNVPKNFIFHNSLTNILNYPFPIYVEHERTYFLQTFNKTEIDIEVMEFVRE